ncbi:Fic family protein, partial [Acinetobacter baumannii]|nr:Fic family protein [Acinetobacter baumannii]
DFYCEVNVIHPFREGNGRTQRIFFEHLLAHCGYGVQWSKINNKEVWIQANIDGFNCRLDGLIAIFEACIITPE